MHPSNLHPDSYRSSTPLSRVLLASNRPGSTATSRCPFKVIPGAALSHAFGLGLATTVWLVGSGTGAIAQTISSLPTATQPTHPTTQPAATYLLFVDPTAGNDQTGDGSQRSPFRTITQALQSAQSNTAILLSPGIYSVDSGEVFPLRLQPGITLQGDPSTLGQGIVIRGGGEYLSRTAARQNITILGSNQALITGVTVINPNFRGYGLWIESSSPLVIENTFRDSLHDGISINGTSAPLVERNVFTENGASGVSVFGNSQPHIEGNLFDQTGFGINLADNAAPMIIGNRITGNRNGIVVQENARPTLRDNVIEANEEDGLVAIARSLPDLGTATDPGNNLFQQNGDDDIEATSSQTIPAFGNQLTESQVVGTVDLTGQVILSPVVPLPATTPAATVTPSTSSSSATTVAAAPGGLTVLPALEPAPMTVTTPPTTPPTISVPPTTTLVPPSQGTAINQPPQPGGTRPATSLVQPQVTTTSRLTVPTSTPTAISVAPPASNPAQRTPAIRDVAPERPEPREVAFVAPSTAPSSSQERAIEVPVPPTTPAPTATRRVTPPTQPIPEDIRANLLPVPGPDIPIGNTGDLPRVSVSRNAVRSYTSSAPTSDISQAAAQGLRYRVLVEGASETVQNEVRALVPGAFRTSVGGRTMMQAGAFGDRANAQELADLLNQHGLSATVQALE